MQQFASIHHRGVAAQQQGFARLGGGIDHGGIRCGKQSREFVAQFFAQLVVQIDQGLVEQQERRVLGQGARQRHPLLLAARQSCRVAIQKHLDVQLLRQGLHPLRHIGVAAQLQGRGDVVEDRHGGVIDELLVDHGHIALAHRHAHHVDAVHPHAAGGRRVQPGHDAHEAGFTGPRGAQQNRDRAGAQGQIQPVQPGLRPHFFADTPKIQLHHKSLRVCLPCRTLVQ